MKIPDEMNKITPGCLAIIMDGVPGNDGLIVTCIKNLGRDADVDGIYLVSVVSDLWEIDKKTRWVGLFGESRYARAARECDLRPISGDQFYTEEDKQRERDLGWLKDKEAVN